MKDKNRRCHLVGTATTQDELNDAIHDQTPLTANCGVDWVPSFSGDEATKFPYCVNCVDDLRVRERELRQTLKDLAFHMQEITSWM